MSNKNYAGSIYQKFDGMLKELESNNIKRKEPKKFSGSGMLTRNSSSMQSKQENSSTLKQQQLKIPLLAMAEIRKRRNINNGDV